MTKEEMANAYAMGFEDEKYREIAYDAFLCGFTAKCESSLPSNLDEAADRYGHEHAILPDEYNDGDIPDYERWTANAFKAGAEWMTGQGYTLEGIARPDDCEVWVNLTNTDIKDGDKVIVQIRHK